MKKARVKKQVAVIHGGDSFKSRKAMLKFLKAWRLDFSRYQKSYTDWKGTLAATLGSGYEVIRPDMPSKQNARYEEWKIWFGKFIPHLRAEVILIGHSLGGLFLAKYLSENNFRKKIRGVFLVAAPWSDGDFVLKKDLKKLEKQAGNIFLYQSKDDRVVKFATINNYRAQLPTATVRIFKNRGHFKQAHVPELVRDIRGLVHRGS